MFPHEPPTKAVYFWWIGLKIIDLNQENKENQMMTSDKLTSDVHRLLQILNLSID